MNRFRRNGEKEKRKSDSRKSGRAKLSIVAVACVLVLCITVVAQPQPILPFMTPNSADPGDNGSISESTVEVPHAETGANESTTSPPGDANESDMAELNYSVVSNIGPLGGISPGIEVNKTIWDPVKGTWVDEIYCAKICDNYTFNCTIHNTGDVPLQNITFWDIASCSLEHTDTNITVCYKNETIPEPQCYNITPNMLPPYPFKPKILHPVNLSWDPHNPQLFNEYFHELCPVLSNEYNLTSWEDTNGDGNLSHCDQIEMIDLKTGNVFWYHVELLPYTLKVRNKGTGKITYFDSELDYQDIELDDPNGTQWKEVCCCKDSYRLVDWIDNVTNPDGNLSECDTIILENKRTGEIAEYHVEEVTIDLVVSREWRIDDYCSGFVLYPGDRIYIEAEAHVIDCGHDCNIQCAKGWDSYTKKWVWHCDDACINVCCIEAEKRVWNGSAWVEETAAKLNDTVRFRIYVHNNGACNFTNITVVDILSDSLNYSDNATVNGESQEPSQVSPNEYKWEFEGSLAPCENITIEFDATVVRCPAVDTNTVNVTAWCSDTMVADEDSATVAVLSKPFLIHGWVNYSNGTAVLNPNVTITNLNTSEVFTATTSPASNHYHVSTTSCNISAGNVLHFYVSDANTVEFNHTVSQDEMDNGGFLQNITISIVPMPDLIVTAINAYHNNTDCPAWFNLSNEIDVTVKNNGTGVADESNVSLYIDGEFFGELPVPSLDAGESVTVTFTNWKPIGEDCLKPPCEFNRSSKYYNFTAIADCDGEIEESNETNNETTVVDDKTRACYNGYMADEPLENIAHGKLNGHIIFTTGDGVYTGLYSVGDTQTTHYNINLPEGATTKLALLNVYYTWCKPAFGVEYACPEMEVNITTPGGTTYTLPLERAYNDTKCTCPDAYYNYPWGTYVYNVTEYITANGTYTVTVKNVCTQCSYFCVAAPGLLILYEDVNAPLIEYWINEGADLLMGGRRADGGCLAWWECINNATFTASSETGEVSNVTLGVVAPWGGEAWGDYTSYLFFNGVKIGEGVYEGYSSPYTKTVDSVTMIVNASNAQVGVNVTDVTAYYNHGGVNVVGQADDGDNMMPAGAFLVVTYEMLPTPQTPFLIYGWVNYSNGTAVLNPNVTVRNLNTSENYTVETNASSNYYQVITSSCNISEGDVLKFSASDGSSSTSFTITVKSQNITEGGFFNLNITIQPPQVGMCGDVTGDNKVDWSDCTLLMNNVTYPGDPSYALKTSRWAADVTGDNKVDWSDCTLLMNNVTYPGDPLYGLKCS